MRIAVLSRALTSAGGVESYLQRLLPLLAGRGHKMLVLGGNRPGQSWPAGPDISATTLPGYHEFTADAASTAAAVNAVESFAPDVVHIHEMDNCRLGLALAARRPVIRHAHVDFTCAVAGRRFHARTRRACHRTAGPACLWHYYASRCMPGWHPRWAVRNYRTCLASMTVWPRMRRLVANSEFVGRALMAAGIPAGKIAVLHYFVPDAEVSPRASTAAGVPELLFAGRIMAEKGLDDLLRAMRLLKSACRLIVAGDGPAAKSARRLAESLGLAERVEFAGWRDDMESLYRRASLVAVPSLWPEPFGLVGVEAMARSLPVVAYRSGGIPEWLEHGVTGLLVEPGDIGGLAAAIDGLLADPDRAQAMGAAGQARQRRLFGAERHVQRLEQIYREAVADDAPPRT